MVSWVLAYGRKDAGKTHTLGEFHGKPHQSPTGAINEGEKHEVAHEDLTLTISGTPWTSEWAHSPKLGLPVLTDILELNPRTTLFFLTGNIDSLLLAGEVDLNLRVSRGPAPGKRWRDGESQWDLDQR